MIGNSGHGIENHKYNIEYKIYVIFNNICIFWNDNFKNKIDRIDSLFFRNYFMSHALIVSFYILSTILSLSSLPTNRNEENDNLFINNNSNQFTVNKRL